MMCIGVQPNHAPLQHDGQPRPGSWQIEAYDAYLAAQHPDDKVLAATARNPALSRSAFNAKASARDEKEYAFDYGLCAALFSDDSDPNCLSAVKNEIEYCYRHSPTFRRSVNYHFATAPQEKIRLRPDVRYTTTVTELQIRRAGRREMSIVLDHDHNGALKDVEDVDEHISGPRALTHEMLHFLNDMCDDNDAENLLGGIVEFNNIVRAEAYGEPARAQYGRYERIDDGRPEGVGGKYFKEYKRIQDQVRGEQANGETPHWVSHRLATLGAQIERDGETAEMIETQTFIGAQNASDAAWSKRKRDVEDENSKIMAMRYEEQARTQRKRQHINAEIAAQAQEQVWRMLNQETRVVNDTLYRETITPGVMLTQYSASQRPAIGPGPSAPAAVDEAASREMPPTGAHRAPQEGETTTKTVALQQSQTRHYKATERSDGVRPFAGTGSGGPKFHIDWVSTNPQGDQIMHGHVTQTKRLDTRQSVQNKDQQQQLTYSPLDFRQGGAASLAGRPSQWAQSASSAAGGNSAAGGQLSPWSTTGMMASLPRPAPSAMHQRAPLPPPPAAASRHDDTSCVFLESRGGVIKRRKPMTLTDQWMEKRKKREAELPLLDPAIAEPVRKMFSAVKKFLPHSKSSSASRAESRLRSVNTAQATASTAPTSRPARLARILEQLRGNIWDGDVIDLAPQLLLRLPDVWPQDRILLIEDTIAHAHTALVPPGHPNFADGGEYHGKDLNKLSAQACANAVHVLRVLTATGLPHYEMIRGKERIAVAADGNCFFRAVMASVRGCLPSEVLGRDIASLRKRLAAYLAVNAAHFVPFLGTDESAPQVQTQAPQPDIAAAPGDAPAREIVSFTPSGSHHFIDSGSDSSCDTVIISSEEMAWDSTLNVVRAEALQTLSRLSPLDHAALTGDPRYADPARCDASAREVENVCEILAHMCIIRDKEAAPELLAARNLLIASTLAYAGNVRRNGAADDANELKYKHEVQGWKRIKPGVREACIVFIRKYEELNEAIAPAESKQPKKRQIYKEIKPYHVSLWNSMAPELRKTIGGVREFSALLGLSVFTMNSRLCASHGAPLAGVRAYTGNTASYRLLMQKWVEMSAWERRMINGLGGFAIKNGLNYKILRSDILRFQAEATERRRAKSAPLAQAESADAAMPEAGLQPKIEVEWAEQWNAVVTLNPQPYDNACFYLSDPEDPKRSMTPETITKGILDEVIYQQVVQWIADEGTMAAARMNALMEVVEAVDDWGERGESVFTRQAIEKNTVIGIYAGKLLRKSDRSYDKECEKYGACAIDAYAFDVIDKDVVLSGYQAGNILSKINSARPDQSVPQEAYGELRRNNLCAMRVGQHMVCLVTTCDLAEGEELLLDYGKQYKITKHQPITVKTEAEPKVQPEPEREGQRVKGSSREVRGKADIVPTELPFLGKAPKGSNTSHVLHHPKTGWYALEKKPAASRALPERYAYLAPQIVLDGQQYYFYYAPEQACLPVAPGKISTLWEVQMPNGDNTGHVLRYDAEAARWCYGELVLRGEEPVVLR